MVGEITAVVWGYSSIDEYKVALVISSREIIYIYALPEIVVSTLVLDKCFHGQLHSTAIRVILVHTDY